MTVSIVIPFYNLEKYVAQCLDSVCAAYAGATPGADRATEIICVDDGSTDTTAALLDEYAAAAAHRPDAPAIRVIHQTNGGEGAARNAGVAAAEGDWVTFLDGDDVWLPNHLSVAFPILERHTDADIVALKYADFNDGENPPEPTDEREKPFDIRDLIPSEIILEAGVFPTFFKRAFVKNRRFSALPLGADRLYMAQCFADADTVVKCDSVVHGYRIRAGSMARAVWNARKVKSQCDYAFGSLTALSRSGKSIGRTGHSYLASLWLSDVPNRLARLPRGERREAWDHWRGTLASDCVRTLPRFDVVRRIIGRCSFSMALSLAVSRILRKAGAS